MTKMHFKHGSFTRSTLVGMWLFGILVGNHCRVIKVPLKMSSKLLNEAVLETHSTEHGQNVSLRGSPGQGYYLELAVGTPAQTMDALVDTGSSNFALAAAPEEDIEKYFNISASQTLTKLGIEVSVPYTQGNWKGFLGQDIIRMFPADNISFVTNVAFITESDHFFISGSRWEGILGLAYRDIARPNPDTEPFFDSLVRQTNISNIFSLQLCGLNNIDSDNGMVGNLVIGGVDESLFSGTIEYVPLYKKWYYEIVITNIAVNEVSLELDCKEYNFDKTIVDSGTTNLRLPTRVYNRLVDLMIEETQFVDIIPITFWRGLDLLCWSPGKTPWNEFPTITLTLATSQNTSIDLVVSPYNYLRPVRDEDSGTTGSSNCYKFSVAASDSGTVIGAVIMEGFYVVFDRQNSQLGFAQTVCPSVNTSAAVSFIRTTSSAVQGNNFDCAYIKMEGHPSMLLIATIVMGTICIICIIPLAVLIIRWQVLRCRRKDQETDQRNLLNEPKR